MSGKRGEIVENSTKPVTYPSFTQKVPEYFL